MYLYKKTWEVQVLYELVPDHIMHYVLTNGLVSKRKHGMILNSTAAAVLTVLMDGLYIIGLQTTMYVPLLLLWCWSHVRTTGKWYPAAFPQKQESVVRAEPRCASCWMSPAAWLLTDFSSWRDHDAEFFRSISIFFPLFFFLPMEAFVPKTWVRY